MQDKITIVTEEEEREMNQNYPTSIEKCPLCKIEDKHPSYDICLECFEELERESMGIEDSDYDGFCE